MKKSFLVLVALLSTGAVFADEVTVVEQPLTLASADTSASINLRAVESGTGLEKEAKAASDALGATIEAKVAEAVKKEVAASVKF